MKTKYGLRILALNTNLYYTSDKVTANMSDPADQFVWMESVLKQSRRNHEMVNGDRNVNFFFNTALVNSHICVLKMRRNYPLKDY